MLFCIFADLRDGTSRREVGTECDTRAEAEYLLDLYRSIFNPGLTGFAEIAGFRIASVV